ncbi:hypothetical protein [Micromonospora okii]|uniref:hypothetical protein n=1 Tax=Micromonospora okii TaxID=1182970 RepID=UPI001E3DC79A|nr:hypothetical protein [Micromonospora okii]
MENELYVVALVRSSERARAAIGQVLGDFARADLLRRVGRPGQTAEELAELAARVRAEFTPARLPAALTEVHLRMLVAPASLPVLAGVLRCPVADVHATLLDAHQLARALRDAGDARAGIADSELLLLSLLPRLPRLAAAHALDAGDWGPFVERRGWLTPLAVRRLGAEAAARSWPADARPSRVLAGILEQTGAGRDRAESSPRFDTLALIELRRRIGLLAEQLREDASTHAEEAALLAPDLTSVARLPAWLQLYERGAVAVGLHRLFTGSTSLAELLQGNYAEPPPVTGDPAPDEGLGITNELAFGTFRKRIAFDVTCVLAGQSEPQVVLRCRGLPKAQYGPVREKILSLGPADLAEIGTSVGERLLNTQVAQHHGLRGRLRYVLRQHGPQAVQCVLLAGVRRPIVVPSPWHEYLATTLPYAEPPDADTRFAGLDEVNRALRAGAGHRRIEEVR